MVPRVGTKRFGHRVVQLHQFPGRQAVRPGTGGEPCRQRPRAPLKAPPDRFARVQLIDSFRLCSDWGCRDDYRTPVPGHRPASPSGQLRTG